MKLLAAYTFSLVELEITIYFPLSFMGTFFDFQNFYDQISRYENYGNWGCLKATLNQQ